MRSGFQCADAAKYEAAAESVCGGFALQIFLFQMLDIAVDAVQFVRNLDVLGTVRHALVAADTAARLSETGHAAVVAHQKRPPGLPVIFVLRRSGHVCLLYTSDAADEL